jgi:Activator of Hsp90 ATPase homolog 1-like protein
MKSNLLHAHLTTQFAGVSPERLYQVYVTAEEHARATGQPAAIEAREGGAFSAYGGYLTGEFIRLVPGKLVMQFWRSKHFKESDGDAILSIAFRQNEYGQAETELLLTSVPDDMTRHDNSSWNYFYWEPFRAYLSGPTAPADFAQSLAQPRR